MPAEERGLAFGLVEHPFAQEADLVDGLAGLADLREYPAGGEDFGGGGAAAADGEVGEADEGGADYVGFSAR